MIDDATAGAGNPGVPQHGDTLAPGTPTNLEVEHRADEFLKESAPPVEPAPPQAEPVAEVTQAAAEPTQAEPTQAAAEPTQAEPVAEVTQAAEPTQAEPVTEAAQAEPAPAQEMMTESAQEAPSSVSSQQELPPLSSYGPPARSFQEMGLHEDVVRALHEMGFSAPMPVQGNAFRPMMAGRDLIVQSRTGSGKTAAFGIPMAQGLIDPSLNCRGGRVQALVLGPTRELALQVAGEVGRIAKHRGLEVVPVYGGAPMGRQVEALAGGAQIVSGTPGRVLDHLRRSTLQLGQLRLLVLDEADEMLSMGFYEEILEIIKRCPRDRQTMLFSATMPEEIESLSRRHMRQPLKLQLSADSISVSDIAHAYYMVSGMGRPRDLMRVLEVERPDSAIVFCNTREETNLVAEYLRGQGLDAEAISSDLSQADRERVMARSKARQLKYLVATDIAARGIDISDLSHVINYTFPESAEVYVHRTGRTGRAGKSGVAISLIGPRELGNFYYLKLTYKIRPTERALPSEEELQTLREGQHLDRLAAEIPDEPRAEWRSLLRRVMASDAGERVLAGLLERHLAGPPKPIAHRPAPVHHAHAHEGEARRDTRPHPERGEHRPERGGLRAERPSAGYGRSERGGRPERGGERGERGGERGGRDRDRGRRRDTFEEEYAESPSRRQQRLAREEQRRPEDGPRAEAQEPQRAEGRGRERDRDRDRGPRRDRPERPARGPRAEDGQPRERPAAEATAPSAELRAGPSATEAAPPDLIAPSAQMAQDQAAPQKEEAPAAIEPAAPSAELRAGPIAAEAAIAEEAPQAAPQKEAAAAAAAPIEAEAAEEGEGEAEAEEGPEAEAEPGTADEEARKRRRRSGRTRKRADTTPPAEPRQAPRAQAQARAPRVDVPGPNDIIEVGDGREFWEAWVDSRNSVAAPAEREDAEDGEGEAEGEADTTEGRARRSRRRRRNGDSTLTLAPGDLRVYLNLGRRDGLDEEQVQAMLRERGLPSFSTEVRSTHTYLAVPEAHVEWVVTSLNGHQIGERSLLCERARK